MKDVNVDREESLEPYPDVMVEKKHPMKETEEGSARKGENQEKLGSGECFKKDAVALTGEAQLIGVSSHSPKDRFDSLSGHTPRLQV